MAWRSTFNNSDWITLSVRSALSVDRYPNGIYIDDRFVQTGWITVSKTAVTTVSESRCYTLAAITGANPALSGSVTLNSQGDVIHSLSYEIQRQNDADAYKCVKTEMTVTITVT